MLATSIIKDARLSSHISNFSPTLGGSFRGQLFFRQASAKFGGFSSLNKVRVVGGHVGLTSKRKGLNWFEKVTLWLFYYNSRVFNLLIRPTLGHRGYNTPVLTLILPLSNTVVECDANQQERVHKDLAKDSMLHSATWFSATPSIASELQLR